jgi:hypothetical protein
LECSFGSCYLSAFFHPVFQCVSLLHDSTVNKNKCRTELILPNIHNASHKLCADVLLHIRHCSPEPAQVLPSFLVPLSGSGNP